MDLTICAASFLLGGVSALILMGLLLLFVENPLQKPKKAHRFQKIVLALSPLTEAGKADQMPESRVGAALRILPRLAAQEAVSLNQHAVAGR